MRNIQYIDLHEFFSSFLRNLTLVTVFTGMHQLITSSVDIKFFSPQRLQIKNNLRMSKCFVLPHVAFIFINDFLSLVQCNIHYLFYDSFVCCSIKFISLTFLENVIPCLNYTFEKSIFINTHQNSDDNYFTKTEA